MVWRLIISYDGGGETRGGGGERTQTRSVFQMKVPCFKVQDFIDDSEQNGPVSSSQCGLMLLEHSWESNLVGQGRDRGSLFDASAKPLWGGEQEEEGRRPLSIRVFWARNACFPHFPYFEFHSKCQRVSTSLCLDKL